MFQKLNKSGRFSVLVHFICWFLIVCQLLRVCFFIWQYDEVSWNILHVLQTLLTGLFFDLGTVAFVCIPAVIYYTLMPNRFVGSWIDKGLVWFFTALTITIIVFTFFAEITFWDEFKTRFNFIAVDYLIYTHEVMANINQSYPLPLLIGGVLCISGGILFLFYKTGAFATSFSVKVSIKQRLYVLGSTVTVVFIFVFFINNSMAEWSTNRYNSEISKSGIYSFFAAFRNNQMKYTEFYTTINNDKAFALVRKKLGGPNAFYTKENYSIHRKITDSLPSEQKKNVVFILVESLSGSFMKEFGNTENITPFLDSLAQKSVFFDNLYATGTRTVRGMEAVTLCIPPTPGQSIVKRPDNANLYTVNSVFKAKGYDSNFFYGGDGYFDNMNAYFGGNGFNIYDRGHGSVLSDEIQAVRNHIEDNEVTFENAWGICDEDIFNKMLRVADKQYAAGQPFFNFVMTTSNHRPYTYPSGKIDIPSGTGRSGAVKYTDFALREFFADAKTKPWFKNTVFVIVADHCASSAGKDEIDVANYHIPAFIINLAEAQNQKINKLCSQIDLFPTLFGLLHWNYDSDFFGKNVLRNEFEERSLMGTYRKLTLMKQDKVMILSDQRKQAFYLWNKQNNSLKALPMEQSFLEETIAWYQTADYLFNHKLLK
ncbi:sulfatase [Flavobacterium akiainvivens]|uniref:Sulfatase n=1 Tax=Flavobacterium akiainvivens TaxID=1202724 RepID=A0A0M9VHC7_9FLAO|nr:LTA synthase family protein [Flavobacterium akiainvivens]KOS05396.1 sulfatase [Flavobacterium akiainvivens]SFQ73706.1 Phosphoglycerol transferase MdoB [Flavobacterium akiainvivens]